MAQSESSLSALRDTMASAEIFVLCTLALTAAAFSSSRCLPPLGKTPFDADKFSGDWFVVGGVHTNLVSATPPPPCIKVSYGVARDANRTSAKMEFTSTSAGKVTVLGSSVGEPFMPGKDAVMQAKWTIKDKLLGGVIRQSVLATDYTRFAVFYACQPLYHEDSKTFDKMEILDVWSRSAVIDASLLDAVRVVLTGLGLPVDTDKFLVLDNKAC